MNKMIFYLKSKLGKNNVLYLCSFFASICTVFTITFTYIPSEQKGSFFSEGIKMLSLFNGYGVFYSLITVILAIYYHRIVIIFHHSKVCIILASLFTLFMLVGDSFSNMNSFLFLFYNFFSVIQMIIRIVGYGALFYSILIVIESKMLSTKLIDTFEGGYEKHFITENIKMWLLILICWSPYLILSFPGAIEWDFGTSLLQYYGVTELTNAVPYLQTWLLYKAISFGQNFLGDENLGIFAYCFVQMLVLSGIFAYSLTLMKKLGVRKILINIVLLFYALIPIFPLYAITICKDVNFGLVLTVISVLIFELAISKQDFFKSLFKPILLIILISITPLLRNAAVWLSLIIIISLAFLLLKSNKAYYFSLLISFFISIILWNALVLDNLNIKPAESTESMSIPFQQTARYVKYHGRDIEPWEKESINRILDYETLADSYDPQIADPVKDKHRENITKSDFRAYYKAYFYGFKKAPLCYIQAFMNASYGYYYPNSKGEKKPFCLIGISSHIVEDANKYCELRLRNRNSYYISMLNLFSSYIREVPPLSIFLNSGFYAWLLIAFLFIVNNYVEKKIFNIVFIPAIFVFIGCLMTPVNAYMRYSIPIIFMVPFLFLVSIYIIEKSLNK